MFRRSSFIFSFLGFLVLLGALGAIAFFSFQAGQSQGYALGASAGGSQLAPAPEGAVPPAPYYYGYGNRPHFGFGFPFFGFLCFGALALLAISAFFGILRGFAWRRHGPWMHRHWGYGPWGYAGGGKEGEAGPGPYPWGPPPWWREPKEGEGEEKSHSSGTESGEPKA
jgi:hypothetical protein